MTRDIFSLVRLNDGNSMPGYGYGVYKAEGEELKKALACAIKTGYRMIDTASFYKNEDIVGEAVAGCGLPRQEIFIVSKIWPTEFRDPAAALAGSLARLKTDYLDAYLLHWPGLDRDLRLKCWETLLEEQRKGKIRTLGVSNFLREHLEELYDNFKMWPAIDQIEVHPRFQQKGLRAFLAEKGIVAVSWSPLGRGAGLVIPAIRQIAEETGRTPAQVVLRWQLQAGLVPVPKSAHEQRIRENAQVFDFTLSPEQMAVIYTLDLPGIEGRIGKDPNAWPPME